VGQGTDASSRTKCYAEGAEINGEWRSPFRIARQFPSEDTRTIWTFQPEVKMGSPVFLGRIDIDMEVEGDFEGQVTPQL